MFAKRERDADQVYRVTIGGDLQCRKLITSHFIEPLTHHRKRGADESPTNMSSIMFTFKSNYGNIAKTILMTGDSTGDIIYDGLGVKDGDAPTEWDIMKVMHHGSSRNAILKGPSRDISKQAHMDSVVWLQNLVV